MPRRHEGGEQPDASAMHQAPADREERTSGLLQQGDMSARCGGPESGSEAGYRRHTEGPLAVGQAGRSRGMALATALLIAVFLVIIGMAFLAFISNDYFLAGKQQNNAAAFYLAKAGMVYYAGEGIPPGGKIEIPASDPEHFCVISKDGSGNVVFEGTVTDFLGHVLARRVIMAPGGNIGRWYETNQ